MSHYLNSERLRRRLVGSWAFIPKLKACGYCFVLVVLAFLLLTVVSYSFSCDVLTFPLDFFCSELLLKFWLKNLRPFPIRNIIFLYVSSFSLAFTSTNSQCVLFVRSIVCKELCIFLVCIRIHETFLFYLLQILLWLFCIVWSS